MAIIITYTTNNPSVFNEIGYYDNEVWTHLAYPYYSSDGRTGTTTIGLPETLDLNEEITLYFANEESRKNNPTYEIYSVTTRTNCTIVKQDQFSLTLTFQSEEATLTLRTYRMSHIAGLHTFNDTCTWFNNADYLENQQYFFSVNANTSNTSYSSITISTGALYQGSQTTAMLVDHSTGHGPYLYASGKLNPSYKEINFGTTPQSVPSVLSQWFNENSEVPSYSFTVNGNHFTWTGKQGDGTPISSSLAKAGYMVTLTFDPEENYQINNITGRYVNGNLSITKEEDNIYSFIMPAAAVTINVDTGFREDIDLSINLTYSINGKQDSTLYYARANVGGGYIPIGSNGIGTVYAKINERLWIYIYDPYTVDENPPEKLYRIEATGCNIERYSNEDYRFIASFTDLEASLHIDAYEKSTISGGYTFNNTCTFFGSDLNRTYYFDQQYLFVGTTRYKGFRITTGSTSSSSNTTVELIRAEDGHTDSLYTNGVLNTAYRTINFGTFTQNIPTILEKWIKQNTTSAKYSINFELTNCTVDIDAIEYYPEDEVVFTLKPNFGYTLDYGTVQFRVLRVTSDGVVESELEVNSPILGTYTLTMPAGILYVYATATANSLQNQNVSCTVYCNNRSGFSNLEIYNANQTYTSFFTGGSALSSTKSITVNAANIYDGRITLISGWELTSVRAISGCTANKASDNTFNVKFTDFNASLQITTNQVEVPVVEYNINYNYSNVTLSNTISSAEQNTIISFTVTPSTGYQINNVTVTRTDNNTNISVSRSGSTYSFTMPDSDVTVNVYTVQEQEPEPTIYSINYNYSNVILNDAIYNSEANRTVSFTVTPSSGYQIDLVTAKRTNGNSVPITKSGSTYSFTMPDSDVTVTITSSLIPTYTSVLTLTFDSNINSINATINGNQHTWAQSGEFYSISYDINTNYVFNVTFNESNYKIDNIGANNCSATPINNNQFYVSFNSLSSCSVDISSTLIESSPIITGSNNGIPFWSPIATKKVIDRDNDRNLLSASGSSTVVGSTNTTLRLNMKNLSLNGSTGTSGSLLQSGGTNTASWRSVEDSTSASALSSNSSAIPTVRDIYHGLPSINGSHSYNSSNSIYAPITGGQLGYILQSMGSGSPPKWVANDIASISMIHNYEYVHNINISSYSSSADRFIYINFIIKDTNSNQYRTITDICAQMPNTNVSCFGFVTLSNHTVGYLVNGVEKGFNNTISIAAVRFYGGVSELFTISDTDGAINYIQDYSFRILDSISSTHIGDVTTSNITLNITSSESSAYPGQINATIYVPSTNTSYSFDSSGMSQSISHNQNELLTLTITTSNAYPNLGIGNVTGANVIVSDIQKMQCYIILTGDGEIDLDIRSYVHTIERNLTNVTYSGPPTSFENELVEFRLTPTTGIINSILITGADSETIIEYSNNGNNSYSFTMPSEDVIITATAS